MPQVPREIIYVQKLHFLGFLLSMVLFAAIVISIFIGKFTGLSIGLLGCIIAYGSTVRKQTFITPAKEAIIRPLAQKLIRQNFTPTSAATAATELFYMLGDKERAENLLLAYLPSEEPLIHTTLADIYLNTNRLQHALACLEPVDHSSNPLVHWTYGRIFIYQGYYKAAVKHFENALYIVRQHGLPRSMAGVINGKFMEWSIKASLNHYLAQCYYYLGDIKRAKRFLWRGNLYLLDYSLWRRNF